MTKVTLNSYVVVEVETLNLQVEEVEVMKVLEEVEETLNLEVVVWEE